MGGPTKKDWGRLFNRPHNLLAVLMPGLKVINFHGQLPTDCLLVLTVYNHLQTLDLEGVDKGSFMLFQR